MDLGTLFLIFGSSFHLVFCNEESDSAGGIYKTLRGVIGEMSHIVQEVTSGIEKLGRGIRNVEDFLDATVEEDCVFECPDGGSFTPNPHHIPSSNGCGAFGLEEYLTEEMLPSSDFVNCCNDHDLCYETCGSDKDECDLKFKKCLYKTCTRKKEHVTKLKHKSCQAGAKLLYTGTTALGCKPYINAQRESCICTPKYQNSRGKDEF